MRLSCEVVRERLRVIDIELDEQMSMVALHGSSATLGSIAQVFEEIARMLASQTRRASLGIFFPVCTVACGAHILEDRCPRCCS